MTDWQKLQLDPWRHPKLIRCPICAALLLDEAGEVIHAKWHADTNVEVRREPAEKATFSAWSPENWRLAIIEDEERRRIKRNHYIAFAEEMRR